MSKESIKATLQEAADVLENFLNHEGNISMIEEAAQLMINSIKNGGKIISCGNGGSMSDAMHFAEEMTGRFRDDRHSLPAISISDPSHITCVANDYGVDYIFSRFIEGVGNNGDVLLAISTSGNSENVIQAVVAARKKNMKIIALTGKDGGNLGTIADIEIRVTHQGYADRIQEVHIKVIHILIGLIEKSIVE